jgi:hypothetical protein
MYRISLCILFCVLLVGCASISDRLYPHIDIEAEFAKRPMPKRSLDLRVTSDARSGNGIPDKTSSSLIEASIRKVLSQMFLATSESSKEIFELKAPLKSAEAPKSLDGFLASKDVEPRVSDYLLEVHIRNLGVNEANLQNLFSFLTLMIVPLKGRYENHVGVKITRRSDQKSSEMLYFESSTLQVTWLPIAVSGPTGGVRDIELEPVANLVNLAIVRFMNEGFFQ